MSTTMVMVLPAKGSALVLVLSRMARKQDKRHDRGSSVTNHESRDGDFAGGKPLDS